MVFPALSAELPTRPAQADARRKVTGPTAVGIRVTVVITTSTMLTAAVALQAVITRGAPIPIRAPGAAEVVATDVHKLWFIVSVPIPV